jgi:adenylate cyclase
MTQEPARKLAVLVHADIVSSTALVQQNETLAHQRIQDVFRRFSEVIVSHGGIAHEIRGDALVAEFSKASDAVAASVNFQNSNATHNEELGDSILPLIRIGIAMGEVVIADGTVTGEGIVLAQRLEQLAEPGGVCIQDAAYQTVPKRLPFRYDSLGERELKGFDIPVRAFLVNQDVQTALPIQQDPLSPDLPEEPSIVVLPFTSMEGDSEQSFFAEGLSEDIIAGLSVVSGLLVIARGSSFAYKGRNVDERTIAKELGVKYVLHGSVRRSTNRCRVTVQLVNAETGRSLWIQKFDRELTELFDLQDDIMQQVVASVSTQILLTEGRLRKNKGHTDSRLWDLVSQARSLLYDMTEDSLNRALVLCEKAISLYPDDDQANCFLATVIYHQVILGFDENRESTLARARYHIQRALEINEEYEWSHMVLAWILTQYGEHEAAVEEVERGLEINPNHSVLLGGMGDVLPFVERPEEAIDYGERALRLDPRNPTIFYRYSSLARACFHCGQYETGVDWAKKAIQRRSNWLEGHVYLIACLSKLGNMEEAVRAQKKCLTLFPEINMSYLILTAVVPGNVPEYKDQVCDALRMAGMPENR